MLTVKEAAERLHVSPQTVYRWIDDGLLQVVKYPTGTVRIKDEEVERLLRPIGTD